MSVVIRVEDVSKLYRLGQVGTGTLSDDLTRMWARFRGKEDPFLKIGQTNDRTKKATPKSPVQKPSLLSRISPLNASDSLDLVWALKDINFEVKEGEVLGIIGRNGAGKSTLLKLLARVTQPTTGQIKVRGRIASLLEVGTGFHPDLTGRENIFLNGAILGMRKHEINRKLDEIIDFSGCDRYIDTPVKRYSSGMHVRLAFAVAAHLEPEVLIIDEVLAVGDAQFQKKCLGKMGEVASGGRTVLFVSHNMTAVRTLCQRTILLDGGRVQRDGGTPESVTEYYKNQQEAHKEAFWDRSDDAPGDEVLRIRSVRIRALKRVVEGSITMEDEIQISTEYWVLQSGETSHITYHLINHEGVTVLTTGNKPSTREIDQYRSSFIIPPNLLNSGTYFLKLLIVRNENSVSRVFDSIAAFEILDAAQRETACVGREPGVICPKLIWSDI